MNFSDSELLRRFVDDGLEDAFTELVRRHLDLVFSAALRQVGPDTQAAEDVALKVFADLARKSSDLVAHPTLTGWLFGSTHLAAIEYRRFESRRLARETHAHAMSQLLSDPTPEADWNRVRPVLDEAIHDLNDEDREAVLLRYFEKRPLAEIGSRLGLSENTARMRVDRALDKLHAALAKRGITSATGALAAALGANAVSAAPAGMMERIGRKASGSRPAVDGRVLSGQRLGLPGGWMAAVTAVFLVCIGLLLWTNRRHPNVPENVVASNAASTEGDGGIKNGTARFAEEADNFQKAEKRTLPPPGKGPTLTIVADDSGKPVPGVLLTCLHYYTGENNVSHSRTSKVSGDDSGVAILPFYPALEQLDADTYADGFVSMKVRFHVGEKGISPTNPILRLARAPIIGGTVLNPDGKPVANAIISVRAEPDRASLSKGESPAIPAVPAVTGPDGRWKMQSIAESLLPKLGIVATHEDFEHSEPVDLTTKPEILGEFRERTHAFHLKRAGTIRGTVVDESGRPLDGAKVLVGDLYGEASRQTKTANDGSFQIRGASLGSAPITAQAEGYAAKTIVASITQDMEPLRLVLDRGSLLRLRVMNRYGQGLSNVQVLLNTAPADPSATVSTQTKFSGRTDGDGRLEWDQAPSGTNVFKVWSSEYLSDDQVRLVSDGVERIVILRQFFVRGKVTDAATGRPISKYKVTFGWPEIDPSHSRTNARFREMQPSGGIRPDGGYIYSLWSKANDSSPECVVKFEADGYRAHISRAIRYDEESPIMDVALEKAGEMEVTLLSPDGQPVSGAEIGIIEPGIGLKLRYGRLLARRPDVPAVVRRTNPDGKLKMTWNPQATHLVAVHSSGFLTASLEDAGENPVFQLQHWSSIEGVLRGVANSVTGQAVTLAFQEHPDDDLAIEDEAAVGPDGRFEFPKAPPGRLVVRQMTTRRSSLTSVFSAVGRSADTTVAPGETATVALGGGYAVSGRIRLPSDVSVPKGGYMEVLLRIPAPVPAVPDELRGNSQAIRQWGMTPEILALSRQAVNLSTSIQENGLFKADTVQAGRHELVVFVMPPQPVRGGNPTRSHATLTHEVLIPEQPGEGQINLGDIVFDAPDRQ